MVANINVGDVFNQTTFAAALRINRKTLVNNQKRILNELKECYEFTYKVNKRGNLSMVQITKKMCDYEYDATNSIDRKKKDAWLQENIPKVIQRQPLNTPTNIGRIFWSNYPEIKQWSTSERTIQNEVQQKTKQLYGKNEDDLPTFENAHKRIGRVIDSRWAFLNREKNEYEPLTEEQEKELKSLFSKHYEGKESWKQRTKVIADYKCNAISEEEKDQNLGRLVSNSFVAACEAFQEKYGRWPIAVKVYQNYDGTITYI